MNDSEVLKLFKESGALMEGHFVLRSGLRSSYFFQCARVCERLDYVEQLATALLAKWTAQNIAFDTVLAPAMGALVIGQEVARQAGKRFIFSEKTESGMALRRGFKMAPEEKILIVEDVVTRGGRVTETLELAREAGGQSVGVAVLVDRSAGQVTFPVPMQALLTLDFPTYSPDALPDSLKGIKPVKPGSS